MGSLVVDAKPALGFGDKLAPNAPKLGIGNVRTRVFAGHEDKLRLLRRVFVFLLKEGGEVSFDFRVFFEASRERATRFATKAIPIKVHTGGGRPPTPEPWTMDVMLVLKLHLGNPGNVLLSCDTGTNDEGRYSVRG